MIRLAKMQFHSSIGFCISREQECYGCETLLPIDEEPPSNTGGCFFSFDVDHGSNKMGFGIARTYPLGSCKFATDVMTKNSI